MDATVAAAVTTAITGYKTDALTQLGGLIPIAAAVLISVALVFMVVRWFRALAHV